MSEFNIENVTRSEVPGTGQTMNELRQELVSSEPIAAPPPELSEEQNALFIFQNHTNLFIQKVNNYPGAKSQIARAWTNAAISPLNKDQLHFSYPEEKELFDLFTELNAAKFILMMHGMVRDGKIEIKKPLLEQSSETPSTDELNKMMENLGEMPKGNE